MRYKKIQDVDLGVQNSAPHTAHQRACDHSPRPVIGGQSPIHPILSLGDPSSPSNSEEPHGGSDTVIGGQTQISPIPSLGDPSSSSNSEEPHDPDLMSGSDKWIDLNEMNEVDSIQSLPEEPHGPDPKEHPEVSVSPYKLPIRKNRGIPPERYDPSYNPKNKNITYPIANYVTDERLSNKLKVFSTSLSTIRIPEKIEEALKDPRWREAMEVEMEALYKNETWKLEELPSGKKPVGCKWVFSVKYNTNGEIERYKARLVANGYTQTYGIDFQETFSPVAKLNTVRVLISLAANQNWPLHQFDVKNAFLYGDLEEEIFMDLPPGYNYPETSSVVCKLQKALYGLKQSPRAWFGRFSGAMKSYGFVQSDSDHTLFLKKRQGKITALIIYVDDMIISGDDTEEIASLEKRLSNEFEMKNLGALKYFLGIEVARSKNGIFLSQRKYVLDLLKEVGMLDCKPSDTPIAQNTKVDEYTDQEMENRERYQKLVGKLIYLSHTRPDIAFAVSMVNQFMHSPRKCHLELVIRILRYLKGSPGKGIMFQPHGHLDVSGYTDADWAGSRTDRRSTSGYFTFVGGNLVTWRSKKQNVVALSSAEAEFRGMQKGMCELLWLRKLMTELGYAPMKEMNLFVITRQQLESQKITFNMTEQSTLKSTDTSLKRIWSLKLFGSRSLDLNSN